MAAPKKSLMAPIDRPLSRAYLRQFQGWSTAYPPGLSNPASMRLMENVMVARDGGVKVRPGLRYISYDDLEGSPLRETRRIVGTHEVFFLNDGTKAYLFAAREDGVVKFFVAKSTTDPANPFNVEGAMATFTTDEDVADIWFTADTTYVKYLQIDNKIFALSNNGETLRLFYVDDTKRIVIPQSLTRPDWTVADKLDVYMPDPTWPGENYPNPATSFPPVEVTPDTGSLHSTTETANIYNVGLFYTTFNEIGESAPSQIRQHKIQRPWSGWATPKIVFIGGQEPPDPGFWSDQLVGVMPADVFNHIWDDASPPSPTPESGNALGWHLYAMFWSDDDSTPVEGVRVDTITFDRASVADAAAAYDKYGFARMTAAREGQDILMSTPSLSTRRNYSDPSRGGQGLVAADRMILVLDPAAPAVIRWTSNQQGEYINFTSNRGGGYKTLTSGNLFIPAAVKLWQNPQSVDSLVILCLGIDGMSTGYYMAPAEVTSQSESTAIMGFEETTATPGTTSPYGCEVYNSALFHPLDDQMQKSTAANYAIRHKSMTDLITNDWSDLVDKRKIVSCEHDGRLYYIVNNPDGADLAEDCNGNEIWVLDAQVEAPTWARWLIQAVSLRKVELEGKTYMSVVQPNGIYVLDPAHPTDDWVNIFDPSDSDNDGITQHLESREIPWRLETNTQGANRAHDAWAYLQQVSMTLGNFNGVIVWGIRGQDVNGKTVDMSKRTLNLDVSADGLPFDFEDHLQIRRTMKEWYFHASNFIDGSPSPSYGQIDLVQYRYAPASVNVGYEYGSVETFEYGRDVGGAATSVTTDGVPQPFADRTQP